MLLSYNWEPRGSSFDFSSIIDMNVVDTGYVNLTAIFWVAITRRVYLQYDKTLTSMDTWSVDDHVLHTNQCHENLYENWPQLELF